MSESEKSNENKLTELTKPNPNNNQPKNSTSESNTSTDAADTSKKSNKNESLINQNSNKSTLKSTTNNNKSTSGKKLKQNDMNGMKNDDGLSDSSLNYPNDGHQSKNRICRDFIRGLCRRKYCRYPHVLSSDLVVFCHDFQNSFCPRVNCKFLHYSIDEEEHYRMYGEFPQMDENELPPPPRFNREFPRYGGIGGCRREPEQMMPPQGERLPPQGNVPPPPPIGYRQNNYNGMPDCHYMNPREYRSNGDFGSMKRSSGPSDRGYGDEPFKRFREDNDRDQQIDITAVIRKFEEEQAMLRRRVEANEIKIAELRASNEYLMAQNAQLRLNTVQVSRVVSTVTNTTPQQAAQAVQAQPTVINAVSMAPVQVATPIVSMATQQQPTLIASNGPQLTIATNTTQGQQLTLAQPNISSLSTSTQQLGQLNQITLTPTLAPAPGGAMGLAINTSQAIAISNATQPIISYPIMAHSILPH